MRKKKPSGADKNFGVQQFAFANLGVVCQWLGGCTAVNAAKRHRREDDPGPYVAFFSRPPECECGDPRLRIKIVGPAQVIYLTLAYWPVGSLVLRQVSLPQHSRSGVPCKGSGGTVLWQDCSNQRISSFERMRPTSEDLTQWRHARYLHEVSKPLFAPVKKSKRGRVSKGEFERQLAAKAAGPGVARASAAVYVGSGYLVERIWVAPGFERVVHLGGDIEPWEVSGLTRFVLKVLIENGTKAGLTGKLIYERAVDLYKKAHPGCEINAKGELVSAPYKPICQFFRLTRGGERVDHMIYNHVVVKGRRQATYTLKSEYIEEGDPRLLACES